MVIRVPNKAQPPILLVEDDEDDAFFVKFAVDKAGIGNRLIVAGDGLEAVRYLTGAGDYADREVHPLPGLLLLDLKMPVMSGFEVLTWLKSRAELIDMPVVVLSSSDLEADKTRATSLGAKEYRVKPSGTQPMRTLLKELHAR
jgi:CheY-like chemotaxis protein